MKWWFIALLIVTISLLFGLHALLLFYFSFSKGSYFIAFLALSPAIAISAYILLQVMAEPKERQDKKLEHLIRESLHELNLPIATIDANITMLKRKEQDAKKRRRIARIEESLERFKRLYNVLAYNLKKEVVPIEKEIVDVATLVEEEVAIFQELKRNSFTLRLEPLRVYTDKIGLIQVVDNIIENGMKYSSKQSSIEVTLQEDKLHIKDYGKGIDASELPLIYQRYYQEDENFTGEGIGLSIVRNYCNTHNVGLSIDSTKGKGTEVVLDFAAIKL